MEELSIEEKAKRYDEAIERAKDYFEVDIDNTMLIRARGAMEYVFPELKESEDERMKNFISNELACLRAADEKGTVRYNELTDAIAWLERQVGCCSCTGEVDDKALQQQFQIWFEKGKCSGRDEVIFHPGNFGLQKQDEQKQTLPKWKYKEDHMPLLRDSLILNKYGCVAKSPSGAIVSDVWVIDYDELAKLPKENFESEVGSKFKVKYADCEYNVLEVKDIAGVKFYGIEDEPNHIDYVKAENCKIISSYGIKENGSPYPTKPAVFSEQNHTDKAEVLFKPGDWITNGELLVGQIVSFDGDYYHYITNGIEQPLHISNAYKWHLWTIKDAKDGDVLVDSPVTVLFKQMEGTTNYYLTAYAGIDVSGKVQITDEPWMLSSSCRPATKEQRDLLFQKIKEAGYEWDVDKKELKKISQEYPLTPNECIKSTWSEEDEDYRFDVNAAIDELYDEGYAEKLHGWLESIKNRVQPKVELSQLDKNILEAAIAFVKQNNHFNCWGGVDKHTVLSALYSLRPKNTWKPSDEQIKAIRLARAFVTDDFDDNPTLSEILMELEKQLKKLREE